MPRFVFAARKPIRAVIAAAGASTLAAAALAGCGEGDADGGLASLVPPDTPFYLEAAIRPEGDRADAIASLSESVAGIDDPGDRIVTVLDQELGQVGLSFADDIDPWLGENAALFARSLEPSAFAGGMPDAAALLEVTDRAAAEAFLEEAVAAEAPGLEERTYEDTSYFVDGDENAAVGLVGDTLVGGTEPALKAAVDASEGESLAGSEDFSEHAGGLDEENLAEMWLDLGTAIDAAAEADGSQVDAARATFGSLLDEPMVMELSATDETATLDSSAAGPTGWAGDTDLLAELPAEAWLGLAVTDAGETVQETVDAIRPLGSQLGEPSLDPDAIGAEVEERTGLDLEEDVLGWVGDLRAYVAGTPSASFSTGTVLDTTDPDASADAIGAAAEAVERVAGRPVAATRLDDAEAGFSMRSALGPGLEVAQRDDQVVGVLGALDAEDVLEPDEALGDAELFEAASDALGDDHQAVTYLGMQDALAVAEAGDTDGSPDYDALEPYTAALSYLIVGTATDDERELTRVVLGIAR